MTAGAPPLQPTPQSVQFRWGERMVDGVGVLWVLVSKQLQKNAENGRRPDKIPQPLSMLEKKSISQPDDGHCNDHPVDILTTLHSAPPPPSSSSSSIEWFRHRGGGMGWSSRPCTVIEPPGIHAQM
ncbi:hypothetical protein An15g01100 [Aspergillus niger]|uniref:Uncharacterized protein n=2 Tax=Aspergillus niger TaxID=5061 RepID=A2R4P1_ASPNC|nr:hypothetical protein An15g01100 [Aspergillus niger]CAK42279.1 hypothetical protein An15g01100 [Aspergillus niger]